MFCPLKKYIITAETRDHTESDSQVVSMQPLDRIHGDKQSLEVAPPSPPGKRVKKKRRSFHSDMPPMFKVVAV